VQLVGDLVDPESLVGQEIRGVTSSWFLSRTGVRALVHTWLTIEQLGNVRIHTQAGIQLNLSEPYDPYEMADLGSRVDVEAGTPSLLQALVGQLITSIQRLIVTKYGYPSGMILTTDVGAVGVADVGDDLVIGPWPDVDLWVRLGMELDES